MWIRRREAAWSAEGARCTAVYTPTAMLGTALSPVAPAQRRATPRRPRLALMRKAPTKKLLCLTRRALDGRKSAYGLTSTVAVHGRGGACAASSPLAAARRRPRPPLSSARDLAAFRGSGNGTSQIRCMSGTALAHRDHPLTLLIVLPMPIAMSKRSLWARASGVRSSRNAAEGGGGLRMRNGRRLLRLSGRR